MPKQEVHLAVGRINEPERCRTRFLRAKPTRRPITQSKSAACATDLHLFKHDYLLKRDLLSNARDLVGGVAFNALAFSCSRDLLPHN